MKRTIILFLLAALPFHAFARDEASPAKPESFSEFTERLGDFIGDLAEDVAPMLETFIDQIKGLGLYKAPEVLPNGDIIIRRKPPGSDDGQTPNDGTVDL